MDELKEQSGFEDNFSRQASVYARHRPHYPGELFSWLASLVPAHELAWDCGTGNGQAAVALADYFQRVIATDASAQQIQQAIGHPCVSYRVARAEQSRLDDRSVDLVTVATALHWFDLDAFYQEVQRVVTPGGVLAAWGYYECRITPALDEIVMNFAQSTIGAYWSDRIRLANNHYRTIAFPFDEIAPPGFQAVARWDLHDLLGFIASWSAAQSYREREGSDPVDLIRDAVSEAWGEPEMVRVVTWPLYLRVGRV